MDSQAVAIPVAIMISLTPPSMVNAGQNLLGAVVVVCYIDTGLACNKHMGWNTNSLHSPLPKILSLNGYGFAPIPKTVEGLTISKGG